MTRTYVYAVQDDGETVYVGCSVNPQGRLSRHKLAGKCSRDATVVAVESHACRRQALRGEATRIAELKPSANVHHNADYQRLKNPAALPIDQARVVWLTADPDDWDSHVLERMPGWTRAMALYRFGHRPT